jgi:glutathione synthase/RimK-type ligase-like ATP-grasp enzyme
MTNTARVVIVAKDDDYTADMVVGHLPRAAFVRLDPGKPRTDTLVQMRLSRPGQPPVLGAPIAHETAVWWRKPTRPQDLTGDDAWSADETTSIVLGLLREADCQRWMNDVHAVERARPKVHQLGFAKRLGMDVPDTLITTDTNAARAFIAAGPTLVKPFTQRYSTFAPASKITADELPDEIGPTPHVFQRIVEKQADLRVTVIGDDIFACRIVSGELDWRLDPKGCDYKTTRLDDVTSGQIVRFMRAMDLTYGAFDFAERDGVPWFLECNAAGEFGFQEIATGAPISKALAAWLLRRP